MYLFSYNMFQWLLFCVILFTLVVTVVLEHFKEGFYVNTETQFKFAQGLMFLEVVNAALKLTKSGVIPTLMQIAGRGLFIFVIIPNEPRIQSSAVVCALFFVYASVETIRYPFYMGQVFSKEWYPLTWLRYTVWIVLYPLGMFLEGWVLYLFIEHRAEQMYDGEYTQHVPLIMIPIAILMLIADVTMLRYMWKQRVKKLGGGSSKQRFRRGPPRKAKMT